MDSHKDFIRSTHPEDFEETRYRKRGMGRKICKRTRKPHNFQYSHKKRNWAGLIQHVYECVDCHKKTYAWGE